MCATVPAANAAASDTLLRLAAECAAPPRFAAHRPAFTAAVERIAVKVDGQDSPAPFWVIRDGGRCVGVVNERLGQLDMAGFDPLRAPPEPPFQESYSWARLLGSRITVAPWWHEMWPTGDRRTLRFEGGGDSLTLVMEEAWEKTYQAQATYRMTLRCDPITGYVWDIETDFATRQGLDAKGEPERVEMLNWQVKVTQMGNRHGRGWPVAWTHERTVFQRGDGALVGFYLNPDANDRSRFKRTQVPDGGFVAKLPDAAGWGIALAHLEKGAAGCPNATCNMWADQHNYLLLPREAGADGWRRVRGRWRWQALPPEVVAGILRTVEMDNTGR